MKKTIALVAATAALVLGAAATPASAGPRLSITVVKTVGTTPGVCGTESAITVAPGTTVYYCYTVTNDSEVTFGVHTLTDDKEGTLLNAADYNLLPGASVNTVTLGLTVDAVITTTTTNTATWEACYELPIPAGRTSQGTVQSLCTEGTASATVTVQAPTTTTAPSTTTIQAAALTTPRYTG
ncbi:hypothetical protein [Rhabdothermincola sediminis]|uniref:hypothetical protein n=1 Tax=Rhabdothermincola sediminis TaxID=2751370 RepID=UPI001AA01EC0|nr:hypothetical protein [Rhabdothermincola sediminis]